MPTVLNIGSGKSRLAVALPGYTHEQVRVLNVDLRPDATPDVCGRLEALPFGDGTIAAVIMQHVLEHLPATKITDALVECRRVVAPGGFLRVDVPDVEGCCRAVLEVGLEGTAYLSGLGPIRPADMLWGHQTALALGLEPMRHLYGFTGRSLGDYVQQAGWTVTRNQVDGYDLVVEATR